MTKFKDVTLAMDLSLNGPGFAVLAVEPTTNKPIALEVSSLNNSRIKTHGEKLTVIQTEIKRLLDVYGPEHIVREKGFSRFAATTQALFKVVGVVDLTLYKHGHKAIPKEIAPTSVKKIVTGNGKSSKEDVQTAVMQALQIEDENYFSNDDESDAAAVGLAYLVKNERIDNLGE